MTLHSNAIYFSLTLLTIFYGSLINYGSGLDRDFRRQAHVFRINGERTRPVKLLRSDSSDEEVEVVNEDRKRPVGDDLPSAQPVADLLVEVVEEKGNTQRKTVRTQRNKHNRIYLHPYASSDHKNTMFVADVKSERIQNEIPRLLKSPAIGRTEGRAKQRAVKPHMITGKKGEKESPLSTRPTVIFSTKEYSVPVSLALNWRLNMAETPTKRIINGVKHSLFSSKLKPLTGNMNETRQPFISRGRVIKWAVSSLEKNKAFNEAWKSKNSLKINVWTPKSVVNSLKTSKSLKTSAKASMNRNTKDFEVDPEVFDYSESDNLDQRNSFIFKGIDRGKTSDKKPHSAGGLVSRSGKNNAIPAERVSFRNGGRAKNTGKVNGAERRTLSFTAASSRLNHGKRVNRKNSSEYIKYTRSQLPSYHSNLYTISSRKSVKSDIKPIYQESILEKNTVQPSVTKESNTQVGLKSQQGKTGKVYGKQGKRTNSSLPLYLVSKNIDLLNKSSGLESVENGIHGSTANLSISEQFNNLVNFLNSFLGQGDDSKSTKQNANKGNIAGKMTNVSNVVAARTPIKNLQKQRGGLVSYPPLLADGKDTAGYVNSQDQTSREKERDRERLQMSIIMGWKKAHRRKIQEANGSRKRVSPLHKNDFHTKEQTHGPLVNTTVMVNPGDSTNGRKIGFAHQLTTLIKNISWTEFEKLGNDVIMALGPSFVLEHLQQRPKHRKQLQLQHEIHVRLQNKENNKHWKRKEKIKNQAAIYRSQMDLHPEFYHRNKILAKQILKHHQNELHRTIAELNRRQKSPQREFQQFNMKQSQGKKTEYNVLFPHNTNPRGQNRSTNPINVPLGNIKQLIGPQHDISQHIYQQQQKQYPFLNSTQRVKDVNRPSSGNCSSTLSENVNIPFSPHSFYDTDCAEAISKTFRAPTKSSVPVRNLFNTTQFSSRIKAVFSENLTAEPSPFTNLNILTQSPFNGKSTSLVNSRNATKATKPNITIVDVYPNRPGQPDQRPQQPEVKFSPGVEGALEMTEFVDEVNGGFTVWSHWGPCSRSCGKTGVAIRTRSCTNPSPINGGQQCHGPVVQTRSCSRKNCPVDGGLSQWTKFGSCTKTCGGGVRLRHRHCHNPTPQYGGRECVPGHRVETKRCNTRKCPAKTLKQPQFAAADPKSLCGFDPCQEAGCLVDHTARCVTDFECNPVFFDSRGKMLPQCKGMEKLYSRIPEVICKYNPCLSLDCWLLKDYCVVDLKCRPVYVGLDRHVIPPRCQGYGTPRVDRLSADRLWYKPSTVRNLASELPPYFAQQLWLPVPPLRINRPLYGGSTMQNVNKPSAYHVRGPNAFFPFGDRKPTVQSPLEREVTEVVTEYLGANFDTDDDNIEDDDDIDDTDEGYVHDDVDDEDDREMNFDDSASLMNS